METSNIQSTVTDDATVTIYHFGFSQLENCIHSYAYRSTNNFASESLPYGQGVKPECTFPKNGDFEKCIPMMMREQRTNQSIRPLKERVAIGGEIQMLVLDRYGYRITTIDRFEDYDSDEKIIYSKFG